VADEKVLHSPEPAAESKGIAYQVVVPDSFGLHFRLKEVLSCSVETILCWVLTAEHELCRHKARLLPPTVLRTSQAAAAAAGGQGTTDELHRMLLYPVDIAG
jgi:hypothetical protein